MFATYSGGGMNGPSSLSIDSQGNVWVANYFGVASLFSNAGTPVFASGLSGNGLLNSYGGAVDVNDTMWVANEQSAGSVNNGLGSVTLFNGAGASPAQYTSGGLNFPIAIAFDTSGVAWVVNYGNSHVTLLSGSGSPLSGATGYTAANLEFPSAVATDSKCNAFVANQSSNTITRVLADGSAFTDYVVGQGPTSVAVDSADNVWSANFYANSVGLVSSAGTVLSGSGYTGGGMNAPRAIAVDGGGNAWVASERGTITGRVLKRVKCEPRYAALAQRRMGSGCEAARAVLAGNRCGGKHLGFELRKQHADGVYRPGRAREDSAARPRPRALRWSRRSTQLHQPKALAHQPLKTRTPDEIVGEFLAREHRKRSRACVGDHL